MANTSLPDTKGKEGKVRTAVENMLADVLARQIVSQITEAMKQAG